MKDRRQMKATLPCLVYILIIMLIFSVSSKASVTLAAEEWDFVEIEHMLYTENGYKEIVKRFEDNKEAIQAEDPALYYYLDGINQVVLNNFQKAYDSFQEAHKLSKAENSIELELLTIDQLVGLADYYADSGKIIDYGSRLQEIAEENDDDQIRMFAYKTIALAYYYLANDEKAREYLEKMLHLAEKHENYMYQGTYYMFNGNILLSYNELEKAKELYEKADRLFEEAGVTAALLERVNQSSLLWINSAQKGSVDPSAIMTEIDQLIRGSVNYYHNTMALGFLYNRKGLIALELGLTQEAVNSFEKSKELAGSIVHFDNRMDSIRYFTVNLAQAYYKNGDYRQAADAYIFVQELDQSADTFKNMDEMNSKVRKFTEKELNEQIQTLTDLKEAQRKVLIQHRIIIGASIIGIFFITRALIIKRRENRKVTNLKNSLYLQSVTDGLTGVYNRKKIFEILHAQEKDCVVALVDIDNFKSINDTYGYLFGDEVIRKIVQTVKASIREEDEVGRYGGEEFLLILRNVNFTEALSILERIRQNIEELVWEQEEGFKTTISIGVSQKENLGAEEIFRLVDTLVHEAKRTGKNKIIHS